MPTLPEPCSKETLLAVLDDIRFHVEQDDSYEGFVEYLMPYPEPCPECRKIESGVPDPDCEVCGGKGEVDYPDGVDFLLRASYRVGNTMGQGGMRIIGRMQADMKVPPAPTETEDG
jgi:hypothetical protein